MKKVIILFSIFIVIFTGLFITMKVMDKKYGIGNEVNTTGNYTQGDGNILGSMQGQSVTHEMSGEGSAAENPEGSFVNQVAIVMDGRLSQGDWEVRRAAGLTNEAIAKTMEESRGLYVYDAIDNEQKQLYAEILLIMRGRHEAIPLCSVDGDEVEKISACVLLDHPEIFYTDGYSFEKYMFAGNVQKIVYSANYIMSGSEIQSMKNHIDQYVQACLKGISQQASEYEKVKYIYEFIILNTEYNLEAQNHQNITSVFVGRQSVCLGYAKAVQYLLQKLDVQCTVVTGAVVTGESHAWNLVKIDGQYYYVDATWGDASYLSDTGVADALVATNFDYLCITTNDLEQTHIIDNPVSLPNCTSFINNYYVKEGLYLNSMDGLALKNIFQNAYSQGVDNVSIRCSDEEVYRQVQENLLDNQQIFQYLKNGTSTLAYTSNEKLYTFTFML